MADTGSLRATTAREAVVRPLARVADRNCVRPGCPAPAQASLTFRYASREAWLERLTDEPTPEAYDLCSSHASRTQPPHGWELRDRRPREEQQSQEPAPVVRDLGGQDTVAVLAAALRAVPEPPPAAEPSTEPDRPVGEDGPEASAPEPDRAAAVEIGGDEPSAEADVEATLEESTSPVLEQPRVPRLFPELDDEGELDAGAGEPDGAPPSSDAPPSGDGSEWDSEQEPEAPAPRPVPAARARGIAPPAHRSVAAPHGTALDW